MLMKRHVQLRHNILIIQSCDVSPVAVIVVVIIIIIIIIGIITTVVIYIYSILNNINLCIHTELHVL
jgi:hypothetical protein